LAPRFTDDSYALTQTEPDTALLTETGPGAQAETLTMERFKTEQEARASAAKLATADGKTRYVIESPSSSGLNFAVDTKDAAAGSSDRHVAEYKGPAPAAGAAATAGAKGKPAATPEIKADPGEVHYKTEEEAATAAAELSKKDGRTRYVIEETPPPADVVKTYRVAGTSGTTQPYDKRVREFRKGSEVFR
jgi:hypothetical protein